MYITPTLTVDIIGKPTLETGYVHLLGCNDENNNKSNCERKGDKNQIINPVRSARLDTKKSFSFKYGMVQVIAQIPEGDWLWPGKQTISFLNQKFTSDFTSGNKSI